MSYQGTVIAPSHFDAEADANALQAAMKGMGTDENAINEIVGHRTLQQRHKIREAYHRLYQKDLVETLKSETRSDYDSLLQTLFRPHPDLLAYDLYKGMKKSGTNSTVLNETICCCNNTEIYMLRKAYHDLILQVDSKHADTRTLQHDVAKETKPPYESLLLRLLQGRRAEDSEENIELAQQSGNIMALVDQNELEHDVRDLYQAGAGHGGKGNPDEFIRIFSDRSKYHMKALWELYKHQYGRTIVEDITDKFPDPIRTALNTVVMALVNLRVLLVCQLHECMHGTGTNEDSLIRLVCLRSEIDMVILKRMYQEFFGKSLAQQIQSDTSGDFRKLLLILIGEA